MAMKVVQYTSILALEREAVKRGKTLLETPVAYSFSYSNTTRTIELHIYLKKP